MFGHHSAPEVVRILGLGDTFGGQEGVGPLEVAVAIFCGPVALWGVRESWREGWVNERPRLLFRIKLQRRCDTLRRDDQLVDSQYVQ